MSATIISRQELEDFLASEGIAPPESNRIFLHEKFALFDEDFLTGYFLSGLGTFQRQLEIRGYRTDENTCVDFTKDAEFFARWAFRQDSDRPRGCTICVGMINFLRSPPDLASNHAINFFVVKANEKLKLVAVEPQTCQTTELTAEQRQNCYRYVTA